jgi:hypothetical protein
MLGELQTLFKSALLQDDHGVASTILGDGLAPHARLAIYRHHVFTILTEVLKAAYPVVCRLVDERFFAYATIGAQDGVWLTRIGLTSVSTADQRMLETFLMAPVPHGGSGT